MTPAREHLIAADAGEDTLIEHLMRVADLHRRHARVCLIYAAAAWLAFATYVAWDYWRTVG